MFLVMTGLSEDGSSNEGDEGICSCLGKSRINRKAGLSMGMEMVPTLPSGKSASLRRSCECERVF